MASESCLPLSVGLDMNGTIRDIGFLLSKLNMRRKAKRRLPNRNPLPISVPESINQCWSIDFMSDSLYCGRKYRTFNSEVREEADRWMVEYNTERPHDSLGKMTPEEYAERAENSKYLL